jgi:hypothetical protein
VEIKKMIQMFYMSFSHSKIMKLQKIKASARVWKVQIKLPCGFCLKKDSENVETTKWIIGQVLN